MLTLDGSEAGNAIFNANVTVGALLIMPDVTNNKILVSDGTSYQEVALSGDATIANTGAITLAAAQTVKMPRLLLISVQQMKLILKQITQLD